MSLTRIVELAKLTGKIKEPKFRALLHRLNIFPNPSLEQMLLRKLSAEAGDQSFDPQLFLPISKDEMAIPRTDGIPYVELGDVLVFNSLEYVRKGRFRFPLLAGHKIFLGTTRSGKSSAIAVMLRQLLLKLLLVTKCWVFDPEDDVTYKNLALSFSSEDFYLLEARNLKRNLFEAPPNCSQEVWFGHVLRNFREGLYLRDGSIGMLSDILNHLLAEGKSITLKNVHQKLIDLKSMLLKGGREYGFYESLKNRVEYLLTFPMYDCVKGFDLTHLASKNLLLLCHTLSSSDLFAFFLNDIVSWLSLFISNSGPVPKLTVVLEEVHQLTNPQRLRRADVTEPIILNAVRTCAKRGFSFVFADQVPSELPVSIMANCEFRAIFNTIEGRDLDAIQRSLSLSWERRTFLSKLPKATCVIQYANPLFPDPFLVAIDQFPLRDNIDDEVEKRKASTLAKLDYIPQPSTKVEPKIETETIITERMQKVLKSVAAHAFASQQEHAKKTGIPVSTFSKIVTQLQNLGLVKTESIKRGIRGNSINLMIPTFKGYKYLKKLGITYKMPPGNGSIAHRYFQHQIFKKVFKKETDVGGIEFHLKAKRVDVGLIRGYEKIAFEVVCTGTLQKEVNNLKRDLDDEWQTVVFCIESEEVEAKLRALISQEYSGRVNFRLLNEFCKS